MALLYLKNSVVNRPCSMTFWANCNLSIHFPLHCECNSSIGAMSLWAFLFILLAPSFLFDDVKGGEVATCRLYMLCMFPFFNVCLSVNVALHVGMHVWVIFGLWMCCPCNLLKIYMTIHFVWWNLLQILIWCMHNIAILLHIWWIECFIG